MSTDRITLAGDAMSTSNNTSPESATTETLTGPPILKLPSELLDKLVDKLDDMTDLQNVQLAGNCRLSKSSDDIMLKRMNTIYVECSPTSIDHLRTFIAHPSRLRYVTNIVYVMALRDLLSREDMFRAQYHLQRQRRSVEVVDEAARIHHAELPKQNELIASGELVTVLTELIMNLPRLKKVSFYDSPTTYDSDPRCQCGQHQGYQHAYNRLRRWQAQCTWHKKEVLEDDAAQRNYLINVAHYHFKSDKSLSPAHMFTALHHGITAGKIERGLVLEFRQHLESIFNQEWEGYMSTNLTTIASVMSKVATFKYTFSRQQDLQISETDLSSRAAHFKRLLSLAYSLNQLVLQGYHETEFDALSKTIMSGMTFPKLKTLIISSNIHWYTDPIRRHDNGQDRYTTSQLLDFILRHKATLQSIYLKSAGGIESTGYRHPSITSFTNLLETLKSALPRLAAVSVDESLSVQRSTERRPYARSYPEQQERKEREETSDLGQLARSYGVEPWQKRPKEGDPWFLYFFGEYISPGLRAREPL